MPNIAGSVPIGGFIAPTDASDVYSTHIDTFGRGGYRGVADLTARDAITTDRRSEWMRVFVASENIEYQLLGGITNSDWYPMGKSQIFTAGSGQVDFVVTLFVVNDILVFANGVEQSDNCSISGQTVTFNDALAGMKIKIVNLS
jgi:hypothetical protein